MLRSKEKWIGPFHLRVMLEECVNASALAVPPESGSAYLITMHSWKDVPTNACVPLYVGGNTGKSARFRTRLGDLIADAFGFYTETTGHHSGGQSINKWCREHKVNPLDLYIAWVDGAECHRCLEDDLFKALKPPLNRRLPSKCKVHR